MHPQRLHSPVAQRQRLLGLDCQQLEAERKKPLVKKGTEQPHSRGQLSVLQSRDSLASSLSPVPYRLEADKVTVPLRFRVNDSPLLLLSLEN